MSTATTDDGLRLWVLSLGDAAKLWTTPATLLTNYMNWCSVHWINPAFGWDGPAWRTALAAVCEGKGRALSDNSMFLLDASDSDPDVVKSEGRTNVAAWVAALRVGRHTGESTFAPAAGAFTAYHDWCVARGLDPVYTCNDYLFKHAILAAGGGWEVSGGVSRFYLPPLEPVVAPAAPAAPAPEGVIHVLSFVPDPESDGAAQTQRDIRRVCSDLANMLIAKNQAYGDSALDPVRVFSHSSTVEQLLVRIDDKLSRLQRGSAAGEDVEHDLLGYLVLLRIARERAAVQK